MNNQRKTPATRQTTPLAAPAVKTGGANITNATKTELINNSTSRIKTREEALRFLRTKEVLLEEEEVTVGALAMALLYLVRGTIVAPAVLVDGMRAVAICMDRLGNDRVAREITDVAKVAIEGFVGEARKAMEGIAEDAAQVMGAYGLTLRGGRRRGMQ